MLTHRSSCHGKPRASFIHCQLGVFPTALLHHGNDLFQTQVILCPSASFHLNPFLSLIHLSRQSLDALLIRRQDFLPVPLVDFLLRLVAVLEPNVSSPGSESLVLPFAAKPRTSTLSVFCNPCCIFSGIASWILVLILLTSDVPEISQQRIAIFTRVLHTI